MYHEAVVAGEDTDVPALRVCTRVDPEWVVDLTKGCQGASVLMVPETQAVVDALVCRLEEKDRPPEARAGVGGRARQNGKGKGKGKGRR